MSYKCAECDAEATVANCYKDLDEEANYIKHSHFTKSLFCEKCTSGKVWYATKLVSIDEYLAIVAMVKL